MAKKDESAYIEDRSQIDALEEFSPKIREILRGYRAKRQLSSIAKQLGFHHSRLTEMITKNENVEQFTTEGERQTYRFLEAVAKPDERFICWYLPDVQGKEPDFFLFSVRDGLMALEVKDWSLEHI